LSNKIKEKMKYTLVGYLFLMGNIYCNTYDKASAGLVLGILAGACFIKALTIRQ